MTQAKAGRGHKGARERARGRGRTRAQGQGQGWTWWTITAARVGAAGRQQQGIVALAVVARTGVVQQQWRRQGQQQGPGWVQRGSNNSSKIGGDAVMAAVRTIAREMRRDKGNTATTTGYCGDGGGKVDSDGGGKSKGSAATTAGYPRATVARTGNTAATTEEASLIPLLFSFFWSGSGHGHKVCFFARYISVT